MDIRWLIVLYCAGPFAACMFCHGELGDAAMPGTRRFYLMISIGGAGGLFVGLIAPRTSISSNPWRSSRALARRPPHLLRARSGRLAGGCNRSAVARSPHGTVRAWHKYVDYIRTHRHDAQFLRHAAREGVRPRRHAHVPRPGATSSTTAGDTDPALREPISYFGPGSGIARALDFYAGKPRRVGIIGLGVGSFIAWGKPGDYFRIYELDPDVVKIAREQFWYLSDSKAKIEVVTGDGRLNMERDAAVLPPDLGGRVLRRPDPDPPLARECRPSHARRGGYNVTNRFVNLAPLLKLVAEVEGMKAILINNSPSDDKQAPAPTCW
jgi:hypothetical protein